MSRSTSSLDHPGISVYQSRGFCVLALVALATGLLVPAADAQGGPETLTLRLNDVEARPGGVAAVVVRTYAPRGVEQGQLCFRSTEDTNGAQGGDTTDGAGAGSPFLALEDVWVFSSEDDAEASATFDPLSQTAVISFESLSGTINSTDGPLAVFFFRLADGVTPGQAFDLQFDVAETFLIDPEGQPVPLEIRAGTLDVLAAGDPMNLAAEGDTAAPGGLARVGVSTLEQLLLGSGQVTFVYDPAINIGPPRVSFDPRYGTAVFAADTSTPGRVVVSFDSPDGTLNTVPGQWIAIDLLIRPDLPIGTVSPVSLDPAGTAVQDTLGTPVLIALESDIIELTAPEVLFADGFESGDLSGWSAASP